MTSMSFSFRCGDKIRGKIIICSVRPDGQDRTKQNLARQRPRTHILFIYKLKKKYIYIRDDCSIGCGRPSSAIEIITIFPAFCARTIVFLIFFVVRAKSISQFVSSCAAHFTDRPYEFVCVFLWITLMMLCERESGVCAFISACAYGFFLSRIRNGMSAKHIFTFGIFAYNKVCQENRARDAHSTTRSGTLAMKELENQRKEMRWNKKKKKK